METQQCIADCCAVFGVSGGCASPAVLMRFAAVSRRGQGKHWVFLGSHVDAVKPQHVLMFYPDTSQVGVGLFKKLAGSLLCSYKVSL